MQTELFHQLALAMELRYEFTSVQSVPVLKRCLRFKHVSGLSAPTLLRFKETSGP